MPKCNAFDNVLTIKLGKDIEFKPCCLFENRPDESFPVNETSFTDFNKNFISNLKSTMEHSWHPGCKSCEVDEQEGFKSIRNKFNQSLSGKENSIEYIEIFFSNQCNLACKMCSPLNSSKLKSLIELNPHLQKWYGDLEIKSNNYNLESIFKDVDLTKLKTVNFIGGEPFISSDLDDFLDFLETKDLTKNLTCSIYTNSTFFPVKFLDKLKKFKAVIILISVDGINDLANYIRTGFEWETIHKTIDAWLDFKKDNSNIYLKLTHTLQAYNIHQFDSIVEFCKQKKLIMEMYPINVKDYLSYKVLPIEYRQQLIESGGLKDQRILDILNNIEFDKELFDKFKEFTYTMDKALNTSIEKTIPNLFKYFEQNEQKSATRHISN